MASDPLIPQSFAEAERQSRLARSRGPRVDEKFADAIGYAQTLFHQQSRLKVYYNNPKIWAAEVLQFYAWSKQEEIGLSVVNNSYTAVKSCHGAGKSAWAAVLVCWFVATRLAMGEKVFVITTAPTYAQVHLVLWEEIRAFHQKANLPGYITSGDEWKMEVVVDGRKRILDLAVGRKPSDTDKNGFQGKHEDNLLIVLDEANGIPEVLFTGAVTQLSGEMNRQKMIAIGNPDDPGSLFGRHDAADTKARKRVAMGIEAKKGELSKPFWNWIQIKAWDTPNFSGEDVPQAVKDHTLSLDWVDRARDLWGEDDPRWTSKVEADFPTESAHGLFSRALIDQAAAEVVDPGYEHTVSRVLAADVSRFGDDRTVVMLNIEGDVTILDSWSKKDSIETATRIHKLAIENHVTQVRVDEGNMGQGVIDILRQLMGNTYFLISMNGSVSSPDLARWRNSRDYWYDTLKYKMRSNQVRIPMLDRLHEELAAIQYGFVKTALKIELKEEIKKRIGHSPDYADCLAYVCADVEYLFDRQKEVKQPGQTEIIDVAFEAQMRQYASSMGMYSVSPV